MSQSGGKSVGHTRSGFYAAHAQAGLHARVWNSVPICMDKQKPHFTLSMYQAALASDMVLTCSRICTSVRRVDSVATLMSCRITPIRTKLSSP